MLIMGGAIGRLLLEVVLDLLEAVEMVEVEERRAVRVLTRIFRVMHLVVVVGREEIDRRGEIAREMRGRGIGAVRIERGRGIRDRALGDWITMIHGLARGGRGVGVRTGIVTEIGSETEKEIGVIETETCTDAEIASIHGRSMASSSVC